MKYTYEISKEHSFPKITIYRQMVDGVLCGWRANANDGFVFYDTKANNTDIDPVTGTEIAVKFYYSVRYFPATFDWSAFSLAAEKRDGIDEQYIF